MKQDRRTDSRKKNRKDQFGSLVSGRTIGHVRSKNERVNDIRMLAYTVFTPNPRPKKIKPVTKSAMLTMVVNSLADQWVIALTTVAKPVTPPKAKLFGNLKK